MKQHFVTFLSPGTFVHEQSTEPVDSWNVDAAREMARDVKERHGATPFAFYFTTRSRGDSELDSRETARSGRYFLGGEVQTLGEIKARGNPDDRILISNMECNGWDRVVVNCNSWKVTQPLEADDTILKFAADHQS